MAKRGAKPGTIPWNKGYDPNQERNAAIYRKFQQGSTATDIAIEYDLSATTVLRLVHRHAERLGKKIIHRYYCYGQKRHIEVNRYGRQESYGNTKRLDRGQET